VWEKILGLYVHFPDGSGNLHEGQIVAASVVGADGDIKVTVQCKDNMFRAPWLDNVTAGPAPKPKELQGGA